MTRALLVTVYTTDKSHTYAFDESVRSALLLGSHKPMTQADAYAVLEVVEHDVVLRCVGETRIISIDGHAAECSQHTLAQRREGIYDLCCGDVALTLYVRQATDGIRRFSRLGMRAHNELTIGRGSGCELRYQNPLVSLRHARLSMRSNAFVVTDLGSANGTYVNGERQLDCQPRLLVAGDVIQILDLTLAVGDGFLSVNAPEQCAGWERLVLGVPNGAEKNCALDTQDARPTFLPAPRLTRTVHPLALQVDGPPPQREEERQSALMQLGPSFLMGLTSIFMAAAAIARLVGGADVLMVAPSLAMAIAMVGGSLVWPVVSRSHSRRQRRLDEARRTQAYVAYLDEIENVLVEESARQEQVIREGRVTVGTLLDLAHELSPMLMNRASTQEDYLDLRVGVGSCNVDVRVTWPQKRFSLVEDPLVDKLDRLSAQPPVLHDVPLALSLAQHAVLGLLGERTFVWEFLRGLIVQICGLYSYTEVKIALVAHEAERSEWEFLVGLRHAYTSKGGQRLVAVTHAGLSELDTLLIDELEGRIDVSAEVLGDYGTHYVVVCANTRLGERSEALRRLLSLRQNMGFSLVYLGRDVSDLPRECSYLVDLAPQERGILEDASTVDAAQGQARRARMFERADVSGSLVPFDPDIMVTKEEARSFALDLARARLAAHAREAHMPESLRFLELFEVGDVAQLGIGQRWAKNDASRSLQTRVGINERGDAAYVDLHEAVHGPHGLIAGTTGSGKSEFIITFVLSLCVNYAPDEVAFVLIDYKGGGLAGVFGNERHWLPHLAGTITNLDGSAIRRSLVSLQSELKRRQRLFNDARNRTGESTMDIYRYLSFYRQGMLDEPLPHLFVIADEFAELKQQEPEFMDELVSAARIGRSLGIHLILATQKPSGVVDDQIWSNARCKIALKVADAADSREMIRSDAAAELTRPGQYYLLVGYNESFSLGQAAYAGMPYQPRERFEPQRDLAVELVDAEGRLVASQRPPSTLVTKGMSELDAILGEIEETAHGAGRKARRLWLEPLARRVLLDELIDRYDCQRDHGLSCVVGELDDPARQEQRCLEVDLTQVGNVMLFGSAASDVDGLCGTMMSSLAVRHDARELWMYAIDLGVGSLSALADLPQVGGVVCAGDDERMRNLVRMLEGEAARRLDSSKQVTTRKEPSIVVALANLAAFEERYEELQDRFVTLTRDAPRCDIHFVVTAPSASTPRMRLRSNFGLFVPTMLNDQSDYAMLLGNLQGMPVPQQERRGLVRLGKELFEFQGARLATTPQQERTWVKRLEESVKARCEAKAPAIPVLPKIVDPRLMAACTSSGHVPVGYDKERIEPVGFDLERLRCMLVLGNDAEAIGRYLQGLLQALGQDGRKSVCFVDPQRVLGDCPNECVLQDEASVCAFVHALDEDTTDARVIVFTSIVQTIGALPASESELLSTYLALEKDVGRRAFVVASELWRTKSLYQDWYKVVSAYGNGIWVGGGFADQTAFAFGRSRPEYRAQVAPSDAFLVVRGTVRSVRLLEPSAHPIRKEE